MEKKTNNWHGRGFTSLLTLSGFIIMSITGLVLYIVPQGRIAYWVHWTFLGMSKEDWGNIHIIASLLFIGTGIFHIYYNWKTLMRYFYNKSRQAFIMKRELFVTIGVTLLLVFSSLFSIPPVSYLLDLNTFIKDSWITERSYEPPFGHAELLSLKSFCKKMNINVEKAKAELEKNNILFPSIETSLEDIARTNSISPMNIYILIKKFEVKEEFAPAVENKMTATDIESFFAGKGVGRKTLAEACEMADVTLSDAIRRLEEKNLPMAADDVFKKKADEYGLNPIDLLKIALLE